MGPWKATPSREGMVPNRCPVRAVHFADEAGGAGREEGAELESNPVLVSSPGGDGGRTRFLTGSPPTLWVGVDVMGRTGASP